MDTGILERIHPFEREFIKELGSKLDLLPSVEELYVFGSTVRGGSNKEHSAWSDVDIAFKIKGLHNKGCLSDYVTKDVESIMNTIRQCFRIKTKYRNPSVDMLLINVLEDDGDDCLLRNIREKGVAFILDGVIVC